MADDAGSAASGMMGKMSTGELLMGLGAAWIFLVDYVIGNRLADDYYGSVALMVAMLALIVLVSMYFSKADGDSGWKAHYPWVATTVVWGILTLAVLDVLNGLINDNFYSGSAAFYEITFYVAAAVAAFGAYQVKSGK